MTNKECKRKIEFHVLKILEVLQEYQPDDKYFSCAYVGERDSFQFWNSSFKADGIKNVEFIKTRKEIERDLQVG